MGIIVGGLFLCVVAFVAVHFYFQRGHFVSDSEAHAGREISQALNRYESDHGHFPAGRSSTEIFQELLDQKYVTDPGLFFVPYRGKVQASRGQRLKPENVSWDITSGVMPGDAASLPVLFVTGFKVTYAPGAPAVALAMPPPGFYGERLTWVQSYWNNDAFLPSAGLLVTISRGNSFTGYKLDSANSVPNFISPDLKADVKTYRQLTPDGVLP